MVDPFFFAGEFRMTRYKHFDLFPLELHLDLRPSSRKVDAALRGEGTCFLRFFYFSDKTGNLGIKHLKG